jgi:hypothetical protein
MNPASNYLLALILSLVFSATTTRAQNPPTVDAAITTHQKSVAVSEAQHLDRVHAFKKGYTAELERHEGVAKAKGDLDGVLAIRADRERMDRPLTAPEMKALPEAARASRAKFDQAVAKSQAQEKAEIQAHDRVCVTALQSFQVRLTRAGDIEGAVKAKNALQALLSGKKDTLPVVAIPPPSPTVQTPFAPAPGSFSASPIPVASEIKGKGSVKNPAAGVVAFDGPNGDGRRGTKGLVLMNDAGVGRNGSEWSFNYTRGGTAWGLQIIHPYGRGQVIVHINKNDIGVSTPEKWSEVGFGHGDKKRVKMARISNSIFPLVDDTEYAVISRVSRSGAIEITINGQVMATARASGVSPLSLEDKPGSDPEKPSFKGDNLPLKWLPGYAGIIVGPLDGGINVCRDVRFTPSAPGN